MKFEGIVFGRIKDLTKCEEEIYMPPRTPNEIMIPSSTGGITNRR